MLSIITSLLCLAAVTAIFAYVQRAVITRLKLRERQYREVQTELAHANRVAVIGQLTASIAHEFRHPLGAVAINGDSALRWLAVQPPNVEGSR